jgi:hypothetical protein
MKFSFSFAQKGGIDPEQVAKMNPGPLLSG